jgi:hypothetical protein
VFAASEIALIREVVATCRGRNRLQKLNQALEDGMVEARYVDVNRNILEGASGVDRGPTGHRSNVSGIARINMPTAVTTRGFFSRSNPVPPPLAVPGWRDGTSGAIRSWLVELRPSSPSFRTSATN